MNAKLFNRLLKKVKNGEAFTKLHDFYYARIVIHIYNKYHSKELGRDVAQEFCAVLISMKREDKYIENPTGWVYKICDNIANRFLLKEKKYNLAYTNENTVAQDESFDYVIYKEYLEQLNKLDPETREIIKLHVWEDLSLKEIAEIMGLNYNTVRTKFTRGKKQIKKYKEIIKK